MIHRYYPSVKILHALIIAIVMMLSACGGGGGGDTSSGGGSAADFAGTYNGSMTATLSTPGQPSQTISGIMQITVDAAGTVNVLLSPPDVWGTGTLSGDNFTITSPFAFNEDGIACDGPATITGEIKNDQISGTFKGTINCTTQGITIPFTIDGTYTVVKAAGAAAAIAGGFMQSVISAIQNVMK